MWTRLLILIIISVSSIQLLVGQSDINKISEEQDDKSILKTENILPTCLIVSGSILHFGNTKYEWQDKIRAWNPNFENHIDDYIQYLPTTTMYLADFAGIKSKNNTWGKTKNLFIAEVITGVIVYGLKVGVGETRPSGSPYSFPSGHTAQSFVEATVLYHEYKDYNRLIAYSGFISSTSVGYLRIMNNVHWTSDVLLGAGIAMLVSNLVYHFEPLNDWNPFKKHNKDLSFSTRINRNRLFVGMNLMI